MSLVSPHCQLDIFTAFNGTWQLRTKMMTLSSSLWALLFLTFILHFDGPSQDLGSTGICRKEKVGKTVELSSLCSLPWKQFEFTVQSCWGWNEVFALCHEKSLNSQFKAALVGTGLSWLDPPVAGQTTIPSIINSFIYILTFALNSLSQYLLCLQVSSKINKCHQITREWRLWPLILGLACE